MMNKTEITTNHGQDIDRERERMTTQYSVSSTTGARARAREAEISPDDLERIRRAYVGVIGRLTEYTAREIEEALKAGMAPEVVVAAIEATAKAPRPSFAYLRAVLRRWARDGLWTMTELVADQDRYQAQKAKWWEAQRNPSLKYSQRSYTEEESEKDFYFDVLSYVRGD